MNLTAKTEEHQELLQLVSFNVGKEEYGIDILKVQEIIRLMNITKVPNSPVFVEGVVNLRGKVIPVIDLRIRLGLKKIEHTNNTRIIVVEINNTIVGFMVDAVSEVLRIPASITEPPPQIVTSTINTAYITSVGKLEDHLLILLDLNNLLSLSEKELLNVVN